MDASSMISKLLCNNYIAIIHFKSSPTDYDKETLHDSRGTNNISIQ